MNRRQGSKREEIRSRNRQSASRTRFIAIGIVALFALFIAFLLIWPSIRPIKAFNKVDIKTYSLIDKNTLGNPTAPVRVDEYSDFQCPACGYFFENVFAQFQADYIDTGKVYFVSNAFAFIDKRSTTAESHRAAEAAYCAMDQNKFWEFSQMLYGNQTGENVGDFSDRRLTAFAEYLQLDMKAFNSCFSSGKYTNQVLTESQAAETAGVNSTPSFLVNGKLVDLSSYDNLYTAINDALAGK